MADEERETVRAEEIRRDGETTYRIYVFGSCVDEGVLDEDGVTREQIEETVAWWRRKLDAYATASSAARGALAAPQEPPPWGDCSNPLHTIEPMKYGDQPCGRCGKPLVMPLVAPPEAVSDPHREEGEG